MLTTAFVLALLAALPTLPRQTEPKPPHLHCGVTQHCTIDAAPAAIELAYLPDSANWHAELHANLLFLRPTTCETTTTRLTLRTSDARLHHLTATAECQSAPTDLSLTSPITSTAPETYPLTQPFRTITDYTVSFRGPVAKYRLRKPLRIAVSRAATRIYLQPDLPSVPVATDRTGRLLPNQNYDPTNTVLFVGEPLVDDRWILTFDGNRKPPRILLSR